MALKPGTTDTTNSDMEHDPQLAADYRRASDAMPPAALDERIRAAARREVGAGPQRKSRKSAWQVPLSLAAVVLLSVTIVLMMREEGVDRVEPELPPLAAETVAPRSTPEPVAKQRVAEAPPPLAAPQASPPTATGALQATPAPVLEPAPPMMAKAQPAAEAPAATAALRDEAVPAERNVASAREAALPMMRSAPVGAAADVAAGPAARTASPSALSAPVPGRVLWHDLVDEPAEKWAQRIVEWRRAGRAADADLLTAEFRRRFPDQPVPDAPAAK